VRERERKSDEMQIAMGELPKQVGSIKVVRVCVWSLLPIPAYFMSTVCIRV